MPAVNICKGIQNVPIGRKGELIGIGDIILMLCRISKKNADVEYGIELLKAAKNMRGKEGPCYFEHGIVAHSNTEASLDFIRAFMGDSNIDLSTVNSNKVDVKGELLKMPIGEKGKKVTLEDIASAFYKVSTHPELEKFRHSGRSYFLEGFLLRGNGKKTLTMIWGS